MVPSPEPKPASVTHAAIARLAVKPAVDSEKIKQAWDAMRRSSLRKM
jgi:hypothetical protein